MPRHTHNHLPPTLPFAWWHDLNIVDEMYQEWACDDPDKVTDWENNWHHLHGNGLRTIDDDMSYVTSGCVDAATHIHTKAPSPSLTNDSHNTELYAVTNVTPLFSP
ncbi:hypothetical protein K439DRAFT_1617279 [Ramaria rubella]|nr:hypothetical protein K439DRAFT_1617279 [Ramaria rubella]